MGRQRAGAPPGGVGGNGRATFLLCPVHCSLALGQRDQCAETEGVRKDPTEPAQPDIELGWLRGANGKEACSLSEDLELLPECEEGSEKGWSRRVSCVDNSVGV